MKIQNKLKREQYKSLFKLYFAFFKEINFKEIYSEEKLKVFATKKTRNAKHHSKNQIYFYLLDDNDNLLGFIHGKILDNIGLICHTYVIPEYRSSFSSAILLKHLCNWFKTNNIHQLETEVNRDNNLILQMPKNGWQLKDEYEDAIVYQKEL